MSEPVLRFAATPEQVFRVGRLPDPWQWTPWQYATDDGTFHGRWDDPQANYRVIYAGGSAYGCFVEVLAQFRPDPSMLAEMADIEGDPEDAFYPTVAAGTVTRGWVRQRAVGSARLAGSYVDIGSVETLAWLRPRVAGLLDHHQVTDLDGAAIRDADRRPFTRDLSHWLYELQLEEPVSGIHFESRHGNGLGLWAIFERQSDGDVSQRLTARGQAPLSSTDRAFLEALRLHGLHLTG